ncbi:hypothetical protein BCV70DRAFT_201063 [Testicularia cyperi]|uniref:Uncharacterized protein n=1 Tax=Testicularia cyperi TaxID=1882483 RepID=A0A317XNQ7_9BASI|nr:hypothetical protein BCV70DRAFT_201063 [Testicularia cyperi]
MTPSEYAKQTKGIEPFDEELSRRVQNLAEQSDKLTEEVISYRKTLPSRRAEAMQRRAEVISALEAKKEEQRRGEEAANAKELEKTATLPKADLKRKSEVAETLQQSVRDITGLQVSILEQATAANEQAKLVKRLRTMPA